MMQLERQTPSMDSVLHGQSSSISATVSCSAQKRYLQHITMN